MDPAPQYPPAPWQLHGQSWGSVFRVRGAELRPDGRYVAAYVAYQPGSPLTGSELLVARLLPGRGREVEVTDLWVDSAPSRDGGRALWALPKGLCDFTLEHRRSGPLSRTTWTASAEGRPIATATFADVSTAAPRLPFSGGTRQPPLADAGSADPGGLGEPVAARLRGSAKGFACRGRWDFDRAGPLGWLAAQRRLASFRLADFRMVFGA
jgi:hypothetical protein